DRDDHPSLVVNIVRIAAENPPVDEADVARFVTTVS
ncbi:MAG: hypothetical protein ACI9EZ_001398, partial [Halobacteriales archaeon]